MMINQNLYLKFSKKLINTSLKIKKL